MPANIEEKNIRDFAQHYFNKHRIEIMSLYSMLHTVVDIEPNYRSYKVGEREQVTAYLCTISYLFCNQEINPKIMLDIEEFKINEDRQFNNYICKLIIKEAKKHRMRMSKKIETKQ